MNHLEPHNAASDVAVILPQGHFRISPSDVVITPTIESITALALNRPIYGASTIVVHYSPEVENEKLEIDRFVLRWNTFAAAQNFSIDSLVTARKAQDRTQKEHDADTQRFGHHYLPSISGVSYFSKEGVLPGDSRNGIVGIYRKLLIEIANTRIGLVNSTHVAAYLPDEDVTPSAVKTLDNLAESLFGNTFVNRLTNYSGFQYTNKGILENIVRYYGDVPGLQEFVSLLVDFPRRILAVRNNLLIPEDVADVDQNWERFNKDISAPIQVKVTSTEDQGATIKFTQGETVDGFAQLDGLRNYRDTLELTLELFLAPIRGTTKASENKYQLYFNTLRAHFAKEYIATNNILPSAVQAFGVDYLKPKGVQSKAFKELVAKFKSEFAGSLKV